MPRKKQFQDDPLKGPEDRRKEHYTAILIEELDSKFKFVVEHMSGIEERLSRDLREFKIETEANFKQVGRVLKFHSDLLEKNEERWKQNEQRWKQNEERWEKNEKRLEGVEHRLERVETRLERVETRLDRVETRIDRLENKFEKVSEKIEEHGHSIEEMKSHLQL